MVGDAEESLESVGGVNETLLLEEDQQPQEFSMTDIGRLLINMQREIETLKSQSSIQYNTTVEDTPPKLNTTMGPNTLLKNDDYGRDSSGGRDSSKDTFNPRRMSTSAFENRQRNAYAVIHKPDNQIHTTRAIEPFKAKVDNLNVVTHRKFIVAAIAYEHNYSTTLYPFMNCFTEETRQYIERRLEKLCLQPGAFRKPEVHVMAGMTLSQLNEDVLIPVLQPQTIREFEIGLEKVCRENVPWKSRTHIDMGRAQEKCQDILKLNKELTEVLVSFGERGADGNQRHKYAPPYKTSRMHTKLAKGWYEIYADVIEDNFMAAIWSKLGTSRKFAFMLDFLAAVTGVIEEFRKQHVETEEFTKAMVLDISAKVKTSRSHYLSNLARGEEEEEGQSEDEDDIEEDILWMQDVYASGKLDMLDSIEEGSWIPADGDFSKLERPVSKKELRERRDSRSKGPMPSRSSGLSKPQTQYGCQWEIARGEGCNGKKDGSCKKSHLKADIAKLASEWQYKSTKWLKDQGYPNDLRENAFMKARMASTNTNLEEPKDKQVLAQITQSQIGMLARIDGSEPCVEGLPIEVMHALQALGVNDPTVSVVHDLGKVITEYRELDKSFARKHAFRNGLVQIGETRGLQIQALMDYGALHSSYIGENYVRAHRKDLEEFIEPCEASVRLGDGSTTLKIKEQACLEIHFVDSYGKMHVVNAIFRIMPLDGDMIIGLPELTHQLSDLFIDMVRTANKTVSGGLANMQDEPNRGSLMTLSMYDEENVQACFLQAEFEEMCEAQDKEDLARAAVKMHTDEDDREYKLLSDLLSMEVLPVNMFDCNGDRVTIKQSENHRMFDDELGDARIKVSRSYWRMPVEGELSAKDRSNTVYNKIEGYEDPPDPAECEILPPWEVEDTIAPEELAGEIPHLFAQQLSFMETDYDTACKEYLDALDVQIAPEWNNPKVKEFFKRQSVMNRFVMKEWKGINIDPIEFTWAENTPVQFHAKVRNIHVERVPHVRAELERLTIYFLEPSDSPVTSPIVDADKATAPYVRICGDYTHINKFIIATPEPIPNIPISVRKLAGFKFYIDIDMVNSFHQFLLAQRTSNYLTITTPWGNYRPKFLPEGVTPASCTLQKAMRVIFSDLEQEGWLVVVFDNMVIGCNSIDEGLVRFEQFLTRCTQRNIFLKFTKTWVGFKKIHFFGYDVTGDGWSIDNKRKAALDAIPFPEGNSREVLVRRMQTFLGFSQYFQHHAGPEFATVRAPLSDMTHKTFDWDQKTWKVDYKASFKRFKELCVKAIELTWPDLSLDWIVRVDACKVGVGVTGFQKRVSKDGTVDFEIIFAGSQKFSGPATRWETYKQEGYGKFWGITSNDYLLRYKPFYLETDHANLLWMFKATSPIIVRWRIALQKYPILGIIHRPGKLMKYTADFLSRIWEQEVDLENKATEISKFSAAEQVDFENFQALSVPSFEDLGTGNLNEMQEMPSNSTYDEVILAISHNGPKLHIGAAALWSRLNQEKAGHNIPFAYIRQFVKKCSVCQKMRGTNFNRKLPSIARHLKVPETTHTVGMDGLTITPPDRNGISYIHVIVNWFTKLVYLHPVKDHTAESAASAVLQYRSLYGPTFLRLVTDPGADYTSNLMKTLAKWSGYEHAFSLVDRHESNGVEGTNKQVIRHIRSLVHDERIQDRISEPQVLAVVTFHINSSVNSETGHTPFALHFGTKDSVKPLQSQAEIETSAYPVMLTELEADIAAVVAASQQYQSDLIKERTKDNPTHTTHNTWQSGDLVFWENPIRTSKVQAPRAGPFRVLNHHKNDVKVESLIDGRLRVLHVSELTLFDGEEKEAYALALRDNDQYVITRVIEFRGNPTQRETCEFLVQFEAEETPIWLTYNADLAASKPFLDFCELRAYLRTLSISAKQAKALLVQLRRTPIIKVNTGDTVYVDLRFYNATWYKELELPDQWSNRYFTKMTYGAWIGVKKLKIDLHCKLSGQTFVADSVFTQLWANKELPENAILISTENIKEYPSIEKTIQDVNHSVLHTMEEEGKCDIWSLNCNGLAAAVRKGLMETIALHSPDIIFLQETKIAPEAEQVYVDLFKGIGYEHVVCSSLKGYAGLMTISKSHLPMRKLEPISDPRVQAIEFDNAVILHVYAPFPGLDSEKWEGRDEWNKKFTKLVQDRTMEPKPTIIIGDLNVCPDAIDATVTSGGGLSQKERDFFKELVEKYGYRDAYRELHVKDKQYTAVSTIPRTRGNKFRLDFLLLPFGPKLIAADILDQYALKFSDHCPISATIVLAVQRDLGETEKNETNMIFDIEAMREAANNAPRVNDYLNPNTYLKHQDMNQVVCSLRSTTIEEDITDDTPPPVLTSESSGRPIRQLEIPSTTDHFDNAIEIDDMSDEYPTREEYYLMTPRQVHVTEANMFRQQYYAIFQKHHDIKQGFDSHERFMEVFNILPREIKDVIKTEGFTTAESRDQWLEMQSQCSLTVGRPNQIRRANSGIRLTPVRINSRPCFAIAGDNPKLFMDRAQFLRAINDGQAQDLMRFEQRQFSDYRTAVNWLSTLITYEQRLELIRMNMDTIEGYLQPHYGLIVKQSNWYAWDSPHYLTRRAKGIGYGLFCEFDITAGQPIAFFKGTVKSSRVIGHRSLYQYAVRLNDTEILDGADHLGDCYANRANSAKGLFKLNSMDDPLSTVHNNAAVERYFGQAKEFRDSSTWITFDAGNDRPCLVLYAISNIPAGQEVFWDYGDEYEFQLG